ncbi:MULTISPECIES: DUF5808 domain-containing protein [Flavobacterium]|jgi:uncharacterized membrane protein|uniref:DUF5808 domain-containing protein n=1 Tax=Flavobacterium hydatis TaxID=991 RepID=A0A085ZYT5_FLAHY|nr:MULTISPECIES: DUF5808 domain-containing protein [Flavobacterium]KFF09599.1 hypothetical protein IW20_23050 [Flavobacterium hydatis]OUL60709.1 hypothetical protein B8T70_19120 [Flavobacterium sp. AJR]OXA93411.1 hypothetical protein B0A62_13420 [Flavobacterium hydatis]
MEPSKETKDKWHQDPSNWIWGIFYYNKEDKRILPPKRIKQLGWTINFANPNSVFFLVILLIVLFILSKRI